jgi:hypothetical protein
VAIPELGTWSLRFEQPDAPFQDRAAVAGRVWTTDVALVRRDTSVGVGCRVNCASLPYCDEPITLTRPRVIVDMAQRLGMSSLRQLERFPWTINSDDDLDALFNLIIEPLRGLPVVVLTQPDKRQVGVPVADYVLDAEELARSLFGVAYVVKLPWDQGFKWTARVGKPWSAFLGAVRTYMPGLHFDLDSPSNHPRTLVDQILFWKGPSGTGEAAFTSFLVERMMQHAATKRIGWGDRMFLPDAKIKHAELARQKTHESGEWQTLYEEEIHTLKSEVEQKEKEIDGYVAQVDEADRARRETDQENRNLRAQVNTLLCRLAEKTGEDPDQTVPIPDSYEELPDWVATHLTGRLVLHSRALRGVKEAVYEDVELVYRGLLLLAKQFRDTQLGFDGAIDKFEAELGRLELKCTGSISRERAGEQGETYFVRHPTSASPRVFLDQHLTKSNSREARYALRIYFFWDGDTQQVVVGWLPSHLDNRMT